MVAGLATMQKRTTAAAAAGIPAFAIDSPRRWQVLRCWKAELTPTAARRICLLVGS
jgi:hypothetical protein